MELIIEQFNGRILDQEGADISDKIAEKFNLAVTDDGLRLVDCITISAKSPADSILLERLSREIQAWLEDANSELIKSATYPHIRDGKEFVC